MVCLKSNYADVLLVFPRVLSVGVLSLPDVTGGVGPSYLCQGETNYCGGGPETEDFTRVWKGDALAPYRPVRNARGKVSVL